MTQDLNRRNIANFLETIVEQFQGISQYEGKIPRIEVDLMLSNIRNLYECVLQMEQISARLPYMPSAPSHPEKEAIAVQSPEIEKPAIENVAEIEIPTQNIDIQEENNETIFDLETENEFPISESETQETETQEIETQEIEEENTPIPELPEEIKNEEEERAIEPEIFSEKPESPKSEKNAMPILPGLFDEIQMETTIPTEKVAKIESIQKPKPAGNNSIIEKAQRKAISDLRAAIGINEKYSFINELFKGDAEAYTQGLDTLNACENRAQAEEMIQNMEMKYNWNKESRPYLSFLEIFERRFPESY